jgi:hypothetical protein
MQPMPSAPNPHQAFVWLLDFWELLSDLREMSEQPFGARPFQLRSESSG